MNAKLSPSPLLARAEWLLALGFTQDAFNLLVRIPAVDQRAWRFRSLQLRLLTGRRQWQEGLGYAERVLPADSQGLRKAAGRFFVAYALAQLGKGHVADAGRLTTQAEAIWPEGKVDPLTLGVEYLPPRAVEEEAVIQWPREQAAAKYLHARGIPFVSVWMRNHAWKLPTGVFAASLEFLRRQSNLRASFYRP